MKEKRTPVFNPFLPFTILEAVDFFRRNLIPLRLPISPILLAQDAGFEPTETVALPLSYRKLPGRESNP